MSRIHHYAAVAGIATALAFAGCGSSPHIEGTARQDALHDQVPAATDEFRAADPSIQRFFDSAYAYAIFPKIVTGAVGIGGAHGNGQVYRGDRLVGYADVSQASIGAQLGGEEYAEIIFFENESSYRDFTHSTLAFDARANAVAASSGAAKSANYERGVVVFTKPLKGLMAQAAVGGQKFRFQPLAEANEYP